VRRVSAFQRDASLSASLPPRIRRSWRLKHWLSASCAVCSGFGSSFWMCLASDGQERAEARAGDALQDRRPPTIECVR
jgi:hypothetical protein